MKFRPKIPPVSGWLEVELGQNEIDHLWKCIDTEGKDVKSSLVGNISKSFEIKDIDNICYDSVCKECIYQFNQAFPDGVTFSSYPNSHIHDTILNSLWVNYQYKHEFNPLHNHSGVFSFVIWLKVPTDWRDQYKLPHLKGTSIPQASDFQMIYHDIHGGLKHYTYYMSESSVGRMVFFPSTLNHLVYPFYESDEERVSISGNISFNSEIYS